MMAAVSVSLAACGSSAAPAHKVPELAVAAEPHTSGPAVCHTLATETGLRQLPAALTDLYSAPKKSAVEAVIAQSTTELNQLAPSAPARLATAMKEAASAVSGLSGSNPSVQSVTTAGTDLTTLSNQVQSVCHFSVPSGAS
jgi:predicted flavoprotein YhiN